MVLAGVSEVYSSSHQLLETLLRIPVSASAVYRVTVAAGQALDQQALYAPTKLETVYAEVDGSMIFTDQGWQEVKLGRVFGRDGQTGEPDLTPSRYCAHLGSYPTFCGQFEALLPASTNIVFITDGAEWIKNWLVASYPKAVHILDYYHAVEHLAEAVKGSGLPADWLKVQRKLLLESNLDQVIDHLKALPFLATEKRDLLLKYYEKNRYRMDYQLYRQAGYCIGSGAIEAAHRTVIQQRMKRSGQRWSIQGAQQMLQLRVALKSKLTHLIPQAFNKAA